MKHQYGVDCSLAGNVTEMLLIRHGCIAAARAGYELELSVAAYARETQCGSDLWWWPLRLCPVALDAGLSDPIRRRFDALGAPPGGVAEHFEALGMLRWITPWAWQNAVTTPSGDRYSLFGLFDGSAGRGLRGWCGVYTGKAFFFGAAGFTAAVAAEVLDAVEPGGLADAKPGVVELISGWFTWGLRCSPEPEVREAAGQYAEAVLAAQVLMDRFPFNMIIRLDAMKVTARCQTALAHGEGSRSDTSRATFAAAIELGLAHHAPFLALLLARDLICRELDPNGPGDSEARQRGLAAIGRAAAAMPAAADDLRGLLRADGLDSSVAAPP